MLSNSSTWPAERLRCEFAMPHCHHTALFKDSYLRTNRINHTKIMRCFPHCCPEHLRRSFCGSSIQLKLQFASGLRSAKRDVSLVIYARFRPEYKKRMPIGAIISANTIESSLQSKDPSKGEWIECKSAKSGKNTNAWVYDVNPSGRWYYPWNGAATLAMRTTQHVFEALVFRRTDAKQLELVADVVSTRFRLTSYRRSAKENGARASPPKNMKTSPTVARTASPTDVVAVHSVVSAVGHSTFSEHLASVRAERSHFSPTESVASPARTPEQPPPTIQVPEHRPLIHCTSGALGYGHEDSDAHPDSPSTSGSPHDRLMRWLHELPTIGDNLKHKVDARADSPTDGVPSTFVVTPPRVRCTVSPEHSPCPRVSVGVSTRSPLLQPQFPLESSLSEFLHNGGRRRSHGHAFPPVSFPASGFFLSPPPASHKQTRRAPRSEGRSQFASSTVEKLMRWLHEQPATSAGSQQMLSWQEMVQAACEAQVTAGRTVSLRNDLVPLLSTLDMQTTTRSFSKTPASFFEPTTSSAMGSPLDAMDAAVRVLLHEWLDVDSSCASNESVKRLLRNDWGPSREQLAAAYSEWRDEVETRAKYYVRTQTRASWSQLLEATQLEDESSGSADGSEFGYRAFVARYRGRIVRQHQLQQQNQQKRQRTDCRQPNHCKDIPFGLRHSSRVWTSRVEDIAIQIHGMNQHAPSLLTIVQFWKHLSCLRLDYSPGQDSTGLPAHLSLASVFNAQVSDGGFTKLTLDGQYRWFNCLPSGEPTIGTTLMGYVVGDYVGRATSAGTIHLTTYLWPATTEASTATAYAWHWTLDAASLSSGSNSSVVSVVVESASVGRTPHAMETMSMAEKLRCVGRWQHACELQLGYSCSA